MNESWYMDWSNLSDEYQQAFRDYNSGVFRARREYRLNPTASGRRPLTWRTCREECGNEVLCDARNLHPICHKCKEKQRDRRIWPIERP